VKLFGGAETLVPVFEQVPGLLRRFRDGERDALACVYRFYFDDVYRLAQHGFTTRDGLRGGRIEPEADRLDFVQDVFVKAFANDARSSYDGLRPYRPFLLRIARNLRVDLARRACREPAATKLAVSGYLDLDELIERGGTTPAPDGFEQSLQWQQLVERTASIVGELEADVRDVARLRFTEELSQLEAAARLGTTRRRIRTLEGRLLRYVRRGLSRAGLAVVEEK
jgi:RNA polymerase sigma factor (sigma-70 family)